MRLSRVTADAPSVRHGKRLPASRCSRWLAFELRLSVTWMWLVPALGIGLIVVGIVRAPGSLSNQLAELRLVLEVLIPLLGGLLAVPLLEQEWARNTLSVLALRADLALLFYLRLAFVLAYLMGVSMLAALIVRLPWSAATGAPPTGQWLLSIALAVLAPMLLLAAIATLVTHLTLSAGAGYMATACLWLASGVAAQFLPAASAVRTFLLFGWSFAPTPDSIGWMTGKAALLAGALLLLAFQLPLLRREVWLFGQSAE